MGDDAKAKDDKAKPRDDAPVKAGDWQERRKPARRRFPHGAAPGLALRVACAREAYADLIQHAKESLRAEVCGVLVGEACEDDDGAWLDVRAVIRGVAASQGAAHVTFTQETWTRIHAERESRHPKLAIVGWYHSHPGFGVEFSDMDVFIHRNFFPAPAQLALLTDPVSGEDAACVNDGERGVRYLDRLWVDGRERSLRAPAPAGAPAAASGGADGGRVAQLEQRIGQLVTTLDEMNERVSRFYLVVGMLAVMLLALWVGASLWTSYTSRYEPPRALSQFSMPLRLGGKDVMVRLDVVGWDVPPELDSILLQLEHERQQAEEAKRAREAEAAKAKAGEPAKSPDAGKPTP